MGVWCVGGLLVGGGVCGVGVFGVGGVLCGVLRPCDVVWWWFGMLVSMYICLFLRGCCLMWFGGVGVLAVC